MRSLFAPQTRRNGQRREKVESRLSTGGTSEARITVFLWFPSAKDIAKRRKRDN